MKLLDVYTTPGSIELLYELLAERTPQQSISHKGMPTPYEHCAFVGSRPYAAWYLIEDLDEVRGACYLSKQREIGVFIFNRFAGHGYGRRAVEMLMQQHPGRVLANVAPTNARSHRLFRDMGFRLLQVTYEKEA